MNSKITKPMGLFLIVLCAIHPRAISQESKAPPVFKTEELEQMVAPIALYPDSLLSQIFMASTYPLEVVQAERWAKDKKDLKDDALTQALEKESWDPSVKSLVNFPQVLTMMSDKLDWTQKLGDAFLAQQQDVMNAVQRLRAKAREQGTLKDTPEQVVKVEVQAVSATATPAPAASTQQVIVIEPANPQVIYVPTYNPTVVYGVWPYPAYPPYYYYPPYYPPSSAYWFGAGFACGVAWGYAWGHCDWHGGDIDIDVNRNFNFNQNINRNNYINHYTNEVWPGKNGQGTWKHNPDNRKGVPYRDQTTGQKFNRASTNDAIKAREDFRGRAEQGRQEIASGAADRFKGQGTGVSTRDIASPIGAGTRPGTGDIGNHGGAGTTTRPSAGDVGNRGGAGSATRPSVLTPSSDVIRSGSANRIGSNNAFQDMDRGSAARNYSNRGQASRANISTTSSGAIRSGSINRPSGGTRGGGRR